MSIERNEPIHFHVSCLLRVLLKFQLVPTNKSWQR